MKIYSLLGCLAVGSVAVVLGQLDATALPGRGDDGGLATGPDVIVGSIPDWGKYGVATFGGESWIAYAVGSTSCNVGTQQLQWVPSPGSNQHPVIPQNMYRAMNGRFEQIGMSWVKHGFCALQQTLCGACTPAGGGCPTVLGIGCSDPYTWSLNGDQGDLGPRSQINPTTGYFLANWTNPTSSDPTTLKERLRVRKNDLDPALNVGAQYFAEAQYVHPQDATNNNDDNNASYRKVIIGTWTTTGYNLTFSGATIQQQPAIFAWSTVNADALVREYDNAGDGRFVLGYRTSSNIDGTYHYEYSVMNLNSDRAGGSFSIPVPAGVTITNIGFRDVDYHSGEPFATTDWTGTYTAGAVTWTSPQTYAQNANTNALRFSTTYSFRFDANTAPVAANGTIGIFKPATASSTGTSVSVATRGPSPLPCGATDLDCDGSVTGSDLGLLLANWGNAGLGDIDSNGIVEGADLGALLAAWTI
ncbi:MAG: hypothetical protein EXS00_07270 [Phycisphaerales bacterium]|nr:hypothetical protein [Phycisphaerales bacterium]